MAADEVVVRDIGGGRAEVNVDGWTVPGVRQVTVTKAVNNLDVVTIEIRARRVSVLPAAAWVPPADRPRSELACTCGRWRSEGLHPASHSLDCPIRRRLAPNSMDPTPDPSSPNYRGD